MKQNTFFPQTFERIDFLVKLLSNSFFQLKSLPGRHRGVELGRSDDNNQNLLSIVVEEAPCRQTLSILLHRKNSRPNRRQQKFREQQRLIFIFNKTLSNKYSHLKQSS